MELYLVQHGEAKKEEEDPERDLTGRGLEDVTRLAAFLEKAGIRPRAVYHSGKKRALSTAEVLVKLLEPEEGLKASKDLNPLDDPSPWAAKALASTEDMMLVGHMPHLGRLATLLLTGKTEPDIINFKPGSIACLRRDATGKFSLAWMLTPSLL